MTSPISSTFAEMMVSMVQLTAIAMMTRKYPGVVTPSMEIVNETEALCDSLHEKAMHRVEHTVLPDWRKEKNGGKSLETMLVTVMETMLESLKETNENTQTG